MLPVMLCAIGVISNLVLLGMQSQPINLFSGVAASFCALCTGFCLALYVTRSF